MRLTTSNSSISNSLVASYSMSLNTAANVNSNGLLTTGNISINGSSVNVLSTALNTSSISTPSLTIGSYVLTGLSLFSGVIDYQEFTANGTWYNPYSNSSVNSSMTGKECVLVMAWGSGGSGSTQTGGGGGGFTYELLNINTVTSTVTVTIPPGPASLASDGPDTIFAANATLSIRGRGGAGGFANSSLDYGGGGGGFSGNTGKDTGGTPLDAVGAGVMAGFGGSTAPRNASAGGTAGSNSIFGGGSGGSSSGTSGTAIGGYSVFGGAAGSTRNATSYATSIFGGNGGNSSVLATTPGGGGGSSGAGGTSAGARGEIRVFVLGMS